MLILSLLALVGALTLRTLISALQALGKVWAEELCSRKASYFLLFRRIVRAGRWEALLEAVHLGEWLLGLFFVGLALAGGAGTPLRCASERLHPYSLRSWGVQVEPADWLRAQAREVTQRA